MKPLPSNESTIHLQEQKPQSAQVTFEVPQYGRFTGLLSFSSLTVLRRNLYLVAGSTLRLKYSPRLMVKKTIEVEVEELSRAYVSGGEKQVWKGSFKKIGLEVEFVQHSGQSNAPGLSSPIDAMRPNNGKLRPTTDEILNICPRFRILVMGKSGAGKSSLINKAFGVTDANVSNLKPGQADINYGIPSKDNPRFLLHDSQGFEHGEDDTVDTVRTFIKNRNEQDDIKEKLHAIWLCLEIPTAGGRLLETGVENFLKLKTEEELGKVPIIAVFTKYDKLVNTERLSMAKLGSDPTLEQADDKAKTRMQKECISPFEAVVGRTVPYTTVSTSPEYSVTLSNLINLTFTNVENYIADAAVVTGISQKVNSNVKIRTSIEVGKRKYWRGLAASTNFPGVTLQECLEVIHLDIVKVWDLDDKRKFLQSEQFRALMSNSVDPSEGRSPNRVLQAGLPMLGAVTAIITALSGPVAPIVIPIVAGLVFAVWVHDVYQKSRTNLRRLMTYILNLTLVMQYLFWIQGILAAKIPPRPTSDPGPSSDRVTVPITRRLIKLALNLYLTSEDREYLLTEISEFSKKTNLGLGGGADATVEKIVELIGSSAINNEEAFKQQSLIKALNESWEHEVDEAWDA